MLKTTPPHTHPLCVCVRERESEREKMALSFPLTSQTKMWRSKTNRRREKQYVACAPTAALRGVGWVWVDKKAEKGASSVRYIECSGLFLLKIYFTNHEGSPTLSVSSYATREKTCGQNRRMVTPPNLRGITEQIQMLMKTSNQSCTTYYCLYNPKRKVKRKSSAM